VRDRYDLSRSNLLHVTMQMMLLVYHVYLIRVPQGWIGEVTETELVVTSLAAVVSVSSSVYVACCSIRSNEQPCITG
jgi:hypothetical protein